MKLWHRTIRDSKEGVTVSGRPFPIGQNGELTVPEDVANHLLRWYPDDYSTTAPRAPKAKKERDS